MDEILEKINSPVFFKKTFNINDFSKKNDSRTDILPAIKAAMKKCSEAGGGRVVIPAGEYLVSGPIHLESNVNLHISEGAYLRFSTNPEDYLPVVYTRWEGVELMNYSPLIYAFEKENIAVTGKGTLDGQASNENWWTWKGINEFSWKKGMPNQSDEGSRPRLFKLNEQEVKTEDRVFGRNTYLRPNFIQPYRCKNVLIDGVTIKNSPMWVIHPVLSENVTVQNVKVISHGPNSDGCNPESCKNVLIKNCYFDTGDDCIALKSGRNQDGRNIGRPIENVVVQDCIMKDGHGGVVIGSEVSGGARNIFAENCQMDSPNLDRAIRVKTNKIRGGVIENLFFRKIMVGEVKEAVVKINMNYSIDSNPEQVYVPKIKNIYIEEVQSSKSQYGILIDGYDKTNPVKNLQLKNCRFNGVEKGNSIKNVDDLKLEEVYLNETLLQSELPVSLSGNPLNFGSDIRTADPSAHVWEDGRLYVYGSHDQECQEDFWMKDWHVFSTDDLVNWTDHGACLSLENVDWADNYAWAPDCAYKNGKYYFCYPAGTGHKDRVNPEKSTKWMSIGIAVSESPTGPFVDSGAPLWKDPYANDPCLFIDDDGKSYLYVHAKGKDYHVIELNDDLTKVKGDFYKMDMGGYEPKMEGPWIFRRGDIYYFTMPEGNRVLTYYMSDSPKGPWVYKGVIMEQEHNSNNHHSIVKYNDQWLLFYHRWIDTGDACPNRKRQRQICAEHLNFNHDGTIQPVVRTEAGLTKQI